MKLRCKKGDMAIIVGSKRGNNGKIVCCEEFLGDIEWLYPYGLKKIPTWRINIDLKNPNPTRSYMICDYQLYPLRYGQEEEQDMSKIKETIEA